MTLNTNLNFHSCRRSFHSSYLQRKVWKHDLTGLKQASGKGEGADSWFFSTQRLQCWDISQKGERDFGASFTITTMLLLWKMALFATKKDKAKCFGFEESCQSGTSPHNQSYLGEGCIQCVTNRRSPVPVPPVWMMFISIIAYKLPPSMAPSEITPMASSVLATST